MSNKRVPPPPPRIADVDVATGVNVHRSKVPNQIDLNSVLVSKGHMVRVFGLNHATYNKMIENIEPGGTCGKGDLYRLVDLVTPIDTRSASAQRDGRRRADIANRTAQVNHPLNFPQPKPVESDELDFTGDEPPVGCTPAELRTFYQAKKEEQQYIKTKNENELASGELLRADDAERTFIEAFKIVAHYLNSIGDILERDGVITHAEVEGVDESIDKIRAQLVDSLMEATKGKVENL